MTPRMGNAQNPGMDRIVRNQIKGCYAVMTSAASWRPYAGTGSLAAESNEYAKTWFCDERDSAYDIGKPEHADRPLLIYIVESARAARMGLREQARDLLDLARLELDAPEVKP